MKKYKINYTNLLKKSACTFIEAIDAAAALKVFKIKFSSYKPTGIVEVA